MKQKSESVFDANVENMTLIITNQMIERGKYDLEALDWLSFQKIVTDNEVEVSYTAISLIHNKHKS